MAETLVREYKVTILVNDIFFNSVKIFKRNGARTKGEEISTSHALFDLTYNLL